MSKIYSDVCLFWKGKYNLSDQSLGKLRPDEVMEIVLPIAKEKKLMFEQSELSVKPGEPFLLKSNETKKLRWRVCFSFSTDNRTHANSGDAILYSIDIDDETGEVLEIQGTGNDENLS